MEEIWRDIEGYEGLYMISDHGRVWSQRRKIYLKQNLHYNGYLAVTLCKTSIQKTFTVHRLVALHFINKMEGKNIVNHIDENKQNNNINNLEWCNLVENARHGTGIQRSINTRNNSEKWVKGVKSRIEKQSTPIKALNIQTGETLKFKSVSDAGRKGFTPSSVSSCINSKRSMKTHKGYKWFKQ